MKVAELLCLLTSGDRLVLYWVPESKKANNNIPSSRLKWIGSEEAT